MRCVSSPRRAVTALVTAVACATGSVAHAEPLTPVETVTVPISALPADTTSALPALQETATESKDSVSPLDRVNVTTKEQATALARTIRDKGDLRLVGSSQSPACEVYAVPEAEKQDQIEVLNAYRTFVSLPPVELLPRDDVRWYTTAASAVANAVTSRANGTLMLSHRPQYEGFSCATDQAQEGGMHSVLIGYWFSNNYHEGPQDGLIADNGQFAYDPGHRVQMLSPLLKRTAFGYAAADRYGSFAMQTLPDGNTPPIRENNTSPRYVLWPSAGYFPVQYSDIDAWSATLQGHQNELGDAKVSIKTPSGKIITPEVGVSGYAPETLYYVPPQRLTAEGTYTVTIVLPSRTIEYQTTFFNPFPGQVSPGGNTYGTASDSSSSTLMTVLPLLLTIATIVEFAMRYLPKPR